MDRDDFPGMEEQTRDVDFPGMEEQTRSLGGHRALDLGDREMPGMEELVRSVGGHSKGHERDMPGMEQLRDIHGLKDFRTIEETRKSLACFT